MFLEVVIATSILLVVFISLVAVYNYYIGVSINNIPLVKSSYLIEEGIEAVKTLRDTSWSSKIAPLTLGAEYYIVYNSATASFDATLSPQGNIDGIYQRTFVLSSVNRDSNSDIQASGTDDPNTRKVTVTVSWSNGSATTQKRQSTYITNLFAN